MEKVAGFKNIMFYEMFFGDKLRENEVYLWNDKQFWMKHGIPREISIYTEEQNQTKDTFQYKWAKRDSYESDVVKKKSYDWLLKRYFGGDEKKKDKFIEENQGKMFFDVGCGSGFSSLLLFDKSLNEFKYLGIDISGSVEVARERFKEKEINAEFIQADITKLPINKPVFDVIFSEGVLHHTDSTEKALGKLVSYLRTGGTILFYVYKKKGVIREFADDYIRKQISSLSDGEAWEKLKPLTKLGKALGDLKVRIVIDEDIDMLGIKKGEYDLQRFLYYNMLKMFYDTNYTVEEMNHVNYDWYRPSNAHRQTPEEVVKWCEDNRLGIINICIEESGITVVARKR